MELTRRQLERKLAKARLQEARFWREKIVRPRALNGSHVGTMADRRIELRKVRYRKYCTVPREGIERRVTNARTLVLMAACAYISTDGTETTRQAFLSLEKAVREYRAAVAIDERSRARKVT